MLEGNKNFEIVRASAGSGKTFKLVLTYLECALMYEDPKYFRRILALTFTNKAAYEMKSRVLEDLKSLVEGKSDKIEDLVKRLSLSESEITRRASLVQQAMLHNYSEISVMTIDKFINRLVKSFARDLAIEQDYRVELDSDSIVSEAVGQLLNKIGEKESVNLTKLLQKFTEQQVFEDKDASVREPLLNLGKNLMKESMKDVVKSLSEVDPEDLQQINKSIRKEIDVAKARLAKACRNAIHKLDALNIPPAEVGKKGGIRPSLVSMSSGDPKEKSNKTLFKMLEDSSFLVLKSFRSEREGELSSIDSELSEVRNAMLAMTARDEDNISQEAKEFKLKKSLSKRIGLLGALSGLVKEVDQVQITNNVRTFDAMHESIAEIVRSNPAPYIYERLGERYNHIFIDEFQDTSVTQWLNLLVLYDHAMSKNGKTLVVGDSKQAIYRFRNGDYKQLMCLPDVDAIGEGESIEEAKRTLIREQNPIVLKENWRSGYDVVSWNNDLFEKFKSYIPKGMEKVYDNQIQIPKKDFPGSVYVDTFKGKSKAAREEFYCEKVVERVKAYKDQGFDYGDITVLVSQNNEGAKVAEKLLESEIKPMTEESLHLGRHPGPLAIISILKWILRPSDFRQSAAIVQCLAALRLETDNPINEGQILNEFVNDKVFDTEGMFNKLMPSLNIKTMSTAPLVPLIGHLCREMGITELYPAYAEGMIELAREVGGSDEGGIKAMLNLWDRTGKSRSVITAKTRDSVQIMTVHKAKGLAFKVVIFMLDNKRFNKSSNHIPVSLGEYSMGNLTDVIFAPNDFKDTVVEDQKEAEIGRIMLDDINKVYVALTRPVEKLDILIGLEKDDDEIESQNPGSVSEILYCSVSDMTDGVLTPGYQTDTQEGPRTEAQKDVQYTQPHQLFTGENIRQIVKSPPAESLATSPSRLNSRELGSAVHSTLERITKLSDWPRVKLALEHSYFYDAIDKATIIERVSTILDAPELQSHFADSTHIETERDFIDKDGNLARPDRLTMTTSGWTVIDYKTQKSTIEKDKKQVLRYVEMISEIEKATAKGILVYTDPFEIVKLN